MSDGHVGLDPVACRGLARELRDVAESAMESRRRLVVVAREGLLEDMAVAPVRLLGEVYDDLVDAARLLVSKIAEMEALGYMSSDEAVEVIGDRFGVLDVGAAKGVRDGTVSLEDLAAVADTTGDVELKRRWRRLIRCCCMCWIRAGV